MTYAWVSEEHFSMSYNSYGPSRVMWAYSKEAFSRAIK